jgi:hypothetical protein
MPRRTLVSWSGAPLPATAYASRDAASQAQITAVQIPRKRIDVSAVRVMTDRAPVQQETAREVGC